MNKIYKKLIVIFGAIILTALLFLPFVLLKNKKPDFNIEQIGLFKTEDLREADFYETLSNGLVKCNLCPNNCLIKPGERGLCEVRENRDGKLYALNYGLPVSEHVDPIEKKPIFHMLPSVDVYSIATAGCNFSCLNCQNWQISQARVEDFPLNKKTPEQIVEAALKSESQAIAYTYSEPTIFYEYMYDTAKLAHENGLYNIMVTNGYINEEPLKKLCQYMDAFNVDLKGFSEEFYQKVTGGKLEPVLNTLKIIKEQKKLLEITYLIIPSLNDSEDEINQAVQWLVDNLGQDTILHFSRFHPDYKLKNIPATPISTLKKAREIALSLGLKYVYTGNMYWPEGETTYCDDGSIAIQRQGFIVIENNLDQGKCEDGTRVPGIWE